MKKALKTNNGIFPMPVLMIATYNPDGTVDLMNAAWGTMAAGDALALNLNAGHRTTKNILERKAFTVSIADQAHMVEADYVGLVSANSEPKKFEKSGLTAYKSDLVDAPIINEFPICMECEFIEFQDGEYGIGLIGKILNTLADEEVIKDGKVDIESLGAIAFDPYTHGYYKLGERVGEAFKDGNKLK